jgi:hypothetical protein
MPDSAEAYNAGIAHVQDEAFDWAGGAGVDIRVLLLKAAGPPTFVATHATVAAVLAHANNTECDDASYGRVAVASGGRNTNQDGRARQYRFDAAVDFTTLDNETVGAALVIRHSTDDDGSIPLSIVIYDPAVVANGAGFTVGAANAVVLEYEGVTNP